jgi:hypothetical protein
MKRETHVVLLLQVLATWLFSHERTTTEAFQPLELHCRQIKQQQSNKLSLSSQSSKELRDREMTKSTSTATVNNQLSNAYNFGSPGKSQYSDALDEKGSFISRMFSPRPLPANDDENEDGWSDMRRVKRWKNIAKLPFKLANKLLFNKPLQEPGTLILVRHGESTWNANKTFTGWSEYGKHLTKVYGTLLFLLISEKLLTCLHSLFRLYYYRRLFGSV